MGYAIYTFLFNFSSLIWCGPFGGSGGVPWNDANYADGGAPTRIEIGYLIEFQPKINNSTFHKEGQSYRLQVEQGMFPRSFDVTSLLMELFLNLKKCFFGRKSQSVGARTKILR